MDWPFPPLGSSARLGHVTSTGIPIIRPPAEFTGATLGLFDRTCADCLGPAPTAAVLDLGPIEVLTSPGLGRMVRLGQSISEGGGALVLAGGRRKIVKLIQTVGLDTVMPHFDTVADARAFVLGRNSNEAPRAGD